MKLPRALTRIMEDNALCVTAYSRYINHTPRFITPSMVESLARECACEEQTAYRLLLAAAMGLDTAEDADHRRIERQYILPGLRPLDPRPYREDAYCKTIRFPGQTLGRWQTLTGSYAAYEPFVWRDPLLGEDLREIPQIGYFTEDFHFPAIHEDGVEWMSVKPNEVETMREPIRRAVGKVLTLGLGMGYFAFHASQKEEVESVTVVEKDPEVIDLFNRFILPQFPHGDKLRILRADAIDYMTGELSRTRYDYIFADLWHDASDGLPLYRELKKHEKNAHGAPVDYWVEASLLSYLRGMVYEKLLALPEGALGTLDPADCLQNRYLKNL